MNEKRLEKLTLALAGLLMLGFAAAGFGLYLRPTARLHARVAHLENARRDEQRGLEERSHLQAEVAGLDATVALQERRLPSDARLDDFVAQAGAQARRCRVRIVELQPGEARPESEVGVLPVRVALQGDFAHIYAWVVALESSARLVRAETVQAQLVQGSEVRAEVQLALYLGASVPGGRR